MSTPSYISFPVVGSHGVDASVAGVLSTLVVATLIVAVFMMFSRRIASPRRPTHQAAYDPLELLTPRVFHSPATDQPPPLSKSRLAWFLPFLNPEKQTHTVTLQATPTHHIPLIPTFPSQTAGSDHERRRWLTDADLNVRAGFVGMLVVAIFSVVGLGVSLPLIYIGVPSLSSYPSRSIPVPKQPLTHSSSSVGGRLFGTYSTLDDFSLLRLLHAHDWEGRTDRLAEITGLSTYHRLVIIFAVTLVFPTLCIIFLAQIELSKASNHRREFLQSSEGGAGWEMGFLSVNAAVWRRKREQDDQSQLQALAQVQEGRRGFFGRIFLGRSSVVGVKETLGETATGLHGLGEARLREVFRVCGLGPENEENEQPEKRTRGEGSPARRRRNSHLDEEEVRYAGLSAGEDEKGQRDVYVEGVYTIPELSALTKLQRERRKVIEALEIAECEYMCCFEPKVSRSGRRPSKKKRTKKPSIMPFGPQGHYTLTSRKAQEQQKEQSFSSAVQVDEIGRNWTGASFTEVGLGSRREDWELGDRIRVASDGRWSRAPTTPALSNFRISKDALREGDSDTVRERGRKESNITTEYYFPVDPSFASSSQHRWTIDSEYENTIEFPSAPSTPDRRRPPDTGFGTLATLSESEDETDDDFSDDGTLRRPLGLNRSSITPSPSGWTESSTGASHLRSATADSSNKGHDRYSTTATSVYPGSDGVERGIFVTRSDCTAFEIGTPDTPHGMRPSVDSRRTSVPPFDDIPSIPNDSDEERYISSRTQAVDGTNPSHPLEQGPASAAPKSKRLTFSTRRKKKQDASATTPTPIADSDVATPPSHQHTSSNASRLFDSSLRPARHVSPSRVSEVYSDVRKYRSELKRLNSETGELQALAMADVSEGKNARGYLLVGKGVWKLSGVQPILGMTRDDVKWERLSNSRSERRLAKAFWAKVAFYCLVLGLLSVVPITLALANSPGVTNEWTFIQPAITSGVFPTGLINSTVPAILLALFLLVTRSMTNHFETSFDSVSVTESRLMTFRASCSISLFISCWVLLFGAVVASTSSITANRGIGRSLADGLLQSCSFLVSFGTLASLVCPATVFLQPLRLWAVTRNLRRTKCPRQRFEVLKPSSQSPALSLGFFYLAACCSALASTLSPILCGPLIVLTLLSWMAIRHTSTFVDARSGDSRGLFYSEFVSWIKCLVVLQPILLGLVLLSRQLFLFGGLCLGFAGLLIVASFGLALWTKRQRRRMSQVSARTRKALDAFELGCTDGSFSETAGNSKRQSNTSLIGRRSMASVFEMMNGISPPTRKSRPPLPLESEVIDSYLAGPTAAKLHAFGRPILPTLSFPGDGSSTLGERGEESKGVLHPRFEETMFPPALVMPRPVLILPDDVMSAGEARELEEYWGIRSVWKESVGLDKLPGLNVPPGRRDI
ncbi:hypothetical protein T439DRAFT_377901 [Meredithblackwellia eburnea MCA 4105]